MTTILKTMNQRFPIPDAWIALADDSQEAKQQRDTRLKRLLAPYLPAITNAQVTYEQEGEETIVRVVSQLGTKGTDTQDASLFAARFPSRMHADLREVQQALQHAPASLPEVLTLAWQLAWMRACGQLPFERLLAHQARIRAVLEARVQQREHLLEQWGRRLQALPAVAAPQTPLGV